MRQLGHFANGKQITKKVFVSTKLLFVIMCVEIFRYACKLREAKIQFSIRSSAEDKQKKFL